MLSWEYPPKIVGGISRVLGGLSPALVNAGCDVDVLTLSEAGAPSYEVHEGVRVHRVDIATIPQKDFFSSVLEFNYKLIEKAISLYDKKNKPDIIHAHDWLVAYAGFTLKHGWKIPLVATIHATEYGRNNGIHNELQQKIHAVEWHLVYESWRVTTCSAFMKDEVMRVFSCPSGKVVVVPNGVEEKYKINFDKAAFRQQYANDDEKLVFFTGRMVPEKGAQILLDAAPEILASCPDTKFLIVGKGFFLDSLKAKALELGISDRIIFTGFVDEDTLVKIYNVADVACFPSLYEPFGIVALEAMAAGVPVATSDAGGYREIVEHGVDGVWTKAGDASSIAQGIVSVLTNEKFAHTLVQNGYKKIRSVYSWKKIAENMKSVYAGVLDECKHSAWGTAKKAQRRKGTEAQRKSITSASKKRARS